MSDFLADGVELFATSCVRDYAVASAWWERLLGGPPTFKAHETEAVWEVAAAPLAGRRGTAGAGRLRVRHA